MEKLLLEQKLEDTLKELGMPLGERIYAEDLDRDADCILFEGFHGQILADLFFKGEHYQDNLEKLVENQSRL